MTSDQTQLESIGVIGAGTMGEGIATLALLSGLKTVVIDSDQTALERLSSAVRSQLQEKLDAQLITDDEHAKALASLTVGSDFSALANCQLIVEAIVECPKSKRELIKELEQAVDASCVIASNTSSLSITELASAAQRPERIIGMHFFNPVAKMDLIEIVPGIRTDQTSLERTFTAAQQLGRRAIEAPDIPGFTVNRCAQPLILEALRLLEDGAATAEQIDRIVRLGGGFKMGPFELIDLIGVDVTVKVADSFFNQSYFEPRWQPSRSTLKLAAAGFNGRKSGKGFYDYSIDPYRPQDPPALTAGGGEGPIIIAGDGIIAQELRVLAHAAGWAVADPQEAQGNTAYLIIDCGGMDEPVPLEGGPQAILLTDGSLADLDPGGTSVGFNIIAPIEDSQLVELTKGPWSTSAAHEHTEHFFKTLGKHSEWVGDGPGLVLGRILAQLVNEACFTMQVSKTTPEQIDTAIKAGLNFPRGPLEWADLIGADHLTAILNALANERHPVQYRTAPLLQQQVWAGKLGRHTSEGFYSYEDAW